ncbi:alpha/beta fold hydrolase [Yinghuangia aomiensis]
MAFDQRGYSPGARPADEAAYDRDALVGDVLAVADALGAATFDLVGHDWGGCHRLAGRRTAPGTAAHRDRRVDSAPRRDVRRGPGQRLRPAQAVRHTWTCSAPAASPRSACFADDAAYLRAAYGGLPDDAVAEYLAVLREPGALTAALNWYRAITPKSLHDAGPITVPALYVWGSADGALGRTAAELTAAHMRGPYRFVELARRRPLGPGERRGTGSTRNSSATWPHIEV